MAIADGADLLVDGPEGPERHAFASADEAAARAAFVDEARDSQADAIIMGVGYKRLIGAFQIGRSVDFVLKNAPCQVWVVRQGLTPGPGHEHE